MTARLKTAKMSSEAQVRITEELKNREWYGWCRHCRTKYNGRIADLVGGCPNCGTGAPK